MWPAACAARADQRPVGPPADGASAGAKNRTPNRGEAWAGPAARVYAVVNPQVSLGARGMSRWAIGLAASPYRVRRLNQDLARALTAARVTDGADPPLIALVAAS